MRSFKIQIPEPCHQDWNAMSKAEKGRFCSVCDKTVVDFSRMSDLEIQQYFLQYKNQKTCGHFASNQLDTAIEKPHILLQYKARLEQIRMIPLRYAALFFIGLAITISGCQNRKVTGEIAPSTHCSPDNELIGDTILVYPSEDTTNKSDSFIEGDIEIQRK